MRTLFLCAVTLKKYRRIGDKLCGTACEQDAFSERFEVMKPVACSFQDFDPVVVALADAVGFVVLPGVLYVSVPGPDHVSNMAYFGRTVDIEPFRMLHESTVAGFAVVAFTLYVQVS